MKLAKCSLQCGRSLYAGCDCGKNATFGQKKSFYESVLSMLVMKCISNLSLVQQSAFMALYQISERYYDIQGNRQGDTVLLSGVACSAVHYR